MSEPEVRDVLSEHITTRWPSTRFAPYGVPGADRPAWYGRKASTAPLPEEFIRAAIVPRSDGGRSLTPPPDGLGGNRAGWPGAVGALAGLALLAGWLIWRST